MIFSKPFFLVVLLASSYAQASDICCISAKTSEESVTTLSSPSSPQSCKVGANTTDGYKVCQANADPGNQCGQLSAEDRCKACGYFWNGTCQASDPVAKAKEELKKEAEKKKLEKKE